MLVIDIENKLKIYLILEKDGLQDKEGIILYLLMKKIKMNWILLWKKILNKVKKHLEDNLIIIFK